VIGVRPTPRDALSWARVEIPVEAILAKGSSRRHRRRLAQLSAAVAASGALALSLATVIGSGSPAPAPAPGTTIRGTAFTLARKANGTASLTLNQGQVLDPATLQRALARDGIPALVQTGTYCTPAPPSRGSFHPALRRQPGIHNLSPVPPDAVTVINPAAMPVGTELSFTYSNHDRVLAGSLIYTATHTCSPAPQASTCFCKRICKRHVADREGQPWPNPGSASPLAV
jgi:hypothetical protein